MKNSKLNQILGGKNIKGFSFFVIASFLFLIFLKFSATYTQTLQIEVKLNGLDEAVKIKSDSLNKIEVLVKASGFDYLPYLFSNPKPLYLNQEKDVKKTSKGYMWDVYNNLYKINESVGKRTEVLSVDPDTLFIKYDILSSKFVPLKINSNLKFNDGYDIFGDMEVTADSVKLIGLENDLKIIDTLETEVLKMEGISESFERSVGFKISDNRGFEVVPTNVVIKGTVKKFTEGVLKIPIVVENVPEDIAINFFPKDIELFYYVDLENYNSINQADFKVVCDFGSITDTEQKFLIPSIVEMPKYIKRTRLGVNRIEFVILK